MRPTVTHVTTERYPAHLWLSLFIPYEDPFMGGRYVAWPDATTPRTDKPVRFVYVHRAGWHKETGRGALLGIVGNLWTHKRHA